MGRKSIILAIIMMSLVGCSKSTSPATTKKRKSSSGASTTGPNSCDEGAGLALTSADVKIDPAQLVAKNLTAIPVSLDGQTVYVEVAVEDGATDDVTKPVFADYSQFTICTKTTPKSCFCQDDSGNITICDKESPIKTAAFTLDLPFPPNTPAGSWSVTSAVCVDPWRTSTSSFCSAPVTKEFDVKALAQTDTSAKTYKIYSEIITLQHKIEEIARSLQFSSINFLQSSESKQNPDLQGIAESVAYFPKGLASTIADPGAFIDSLDTTDDNSTTGGAHLVDDDSEDVTSDQPSDEPTTEADSLEQTETTGDEGLNLACPETTKPKGDKPPKVSDNSTKSPTDTDSTSQPSEDQGLLDFVKPYARTGAIVPASTTLCGYTDIKNFAQTDTTIKSVIGDTTFNSIMTQDNPAPSGSTATPPSTSSHTTTTTTTGTTSQSGGGNSNRKAGGTVMEALGITGIGAVLIAAVVMYQGEIKAGFSKVGKGFSYAKNWTVYKVENVFYKELMIKEGLLQTQAKTDTKPTAEERRAKAIADRQAETERFEAELKTATKEVTLTVPDGEGGFKKKTVTRELSSTEKTFRRVKNRLSKITPSKKTLGRLSKIGGLAVGLGGSIAMTFLGKQMADTNLAEGTGQTPTEAPATGAFKQDLGLLNAKLVCIAKELDLRKAATEKLLGQ